jgi:hypothetical protein
MPVTVAMAVVPVRAVFVLVLWRRWRAAVAWIFFSKLRS